MIRTYFAPAFFPIMDAFIRRVQGKYENRATYFVTCDGNETHLYERENKILTAGNGILKVYFPREGTAVSKISLALMEFTIRLLIGYPIFIFSHNRKVYFTKYDVLGTRNNPIINTTIYRTKSTSLEFVPKRHIRERKSQYRECIGYLSISGNKITTMRDEVGENVYCFIDKIRVYKNYGIYFPYFSPPTDLDEMAQYVQRIYFVDRNYFNTGRGAFTYLWHTNPVLRGVKWIITKKKKMS